MLIFLDSNIPIYAHSGVARKAAIARNLLGNRPVLSVQVLNEFTAVLLRKSELDWTELREQVAWIRSICEVVPITEATHEKALAIAERYQLHIYDANIWAAAILAGCETLYSEDMHDGLTIKGTTLRNPFGG